MKRKRCELTKGKRLRRRRIKNVHVEKEVRYPAPLSNGVDKYKTILNTYINSLFLSTSQSDKKRTLKKYVFNPKIFHGIETDNIDSVSYKQIIPYLNFGASEEERCSLGDDCWVFNMYVKKIRKIPIDPDGLCFVCRALKCRERFLALENLKMRGKDLSNEMTDSSNSVQNPYFFLVNRRHEFSLTKCLHSYDFEYCGIYKSFPVICEDCIYASDQFVFFHNNMFCGVRDEITRCFAFNVIRPEDPKTSRTTTSNGELSEIFKKNVIFANKPNKIGIEMAKVCLISFTKNNGIPSCGNYPLDKTRTLTYIRPYWNPKYRGVMLYDSHPWLFIKFNYILVVIIGVMCNTLKSSDTSRKGTTKQRVINKNTRMVDNLNSYDIEIYCNELARWARVITNIHESKEFTSFEYSNPWGDKSLNLEQTTVVQIHDNALYMYNREILKYLCTCSDEKKGIFVLALDFFKDHANEDIFESMKKGLEFESYKFSVGVVCLMFNHVTNKEHEAFLGLLPLFSYIIYEEMFPSDNELTPHVFSLIPNGLPYKPTPHMSKEEYREIFIKIVKNVDGEHLLSSLRTIKKIWGKHPRAKCYSDRVTKPRPRGWFRKRSNQMSGPSTQVPLQREESNMKMDVPLQREESNMKMDVPLQREESNMKMGVPDEQREVPKGKFPWTRWYKRCSHTEYLKTIKNCSFFHNWRTLIVSHTLKKWRSIRHTIKIAIELYDANVPGFRDFINSLFIDLIFNTHNSNESVTNDLVDNDSGFLDRKFWRVIKIRFLFFKDVPEEFKPLMFDSNIFRFMIIEYLINHRDSNILDNDFVSNARERVKRFRDLFWKNFGFNFDNEKFRELTNLRVGIRIENCCKNILNSTTIVSGVVGEDEITPKFSITIIKKIKEELVREFALNILFQREWYVKKQLPNGMVMNMVKDGVFIDVDNLPKPEVLKEISLLKRFASIVKALRIMKLEDSQVNIVESIFQKYIDVKNVVKKVEVFSDIYKLTPFTKGLLFTIFKYRLRLTRIKQYDITRSERVNQEMKNNAMNGKFFEDLVACEICCNRVCSFGANINQGVIKVKGRKKKKVESLSGVKDVETSKVNNLECYCSKNYKIMRYYKFGYSNSGVEDGDVEMSQSVRGGGGGGGGGGDGGDGDGIDITNAVKKKSLDYIKLINFLSKTIQSKMIDLFYYPDKKIERFVYYQNLLFGDDSVPDWAIANIAECESNHIDLYENSEEFNYYEDELVVFGECDETNTHVLCFNNGCLYLKRRTESDCDEDDIDCDEGIDCDRCGDVVNIGEVCDSCGCVSYKRTDCGGVILKHLPLEYKTHLLKNYLFKHVIHSKIYSVCKKWSKVIYRRLDHKYFFSQNKCSVYPSVGKIFLIRSKKFNSHVFVRACSQCGDLKRFNDPLKSRCLECSKSTSNYLHEDNSMSIGVLRLRDFF